MPAASGPGLSHAVGKGTLQGRQSRPGKGGYRPDIEGLRGVAVLLVVLFHAGVRGMGGGFIGVDVFFVLSGYLITDLLVKEVERTGSISFLNFYARRTRRLLPAAVLVLGVTVLAGAIVFSPVEQLHYIQSALATSLYASNLQFLRRASQYFAPDMAADPFTHTWSLAVEEQFYLVWPLLTLLGFGALRSRGRVMRVIGVVCLVAFVGCLWLTWIRKPWAFFASPARAWEFGLGGLASMIPVAMLRARPDGCRRLGWVGLVAIVASAAVISGDWLFPGAWALWPVLGTIAVLVAGVGATGAGVGRPLGTLPMQWLGKLSYSWYLWHWPVLVASAALWPDLSVRGRLVAALVALAAAALSYVLVENRIRFHPALVPHPRRSLALAGALSVAALGIALGARSYARYASSLPSQKVFAAAEWDRSGIYGTGCLTRFESDKPKVCVFGDLASPITLVVMGDSHAAHWFAALHRIADERRWKLISMIKAGCATPHVPVFDERVGHAEDSCDGWRRASLQRIIDIKPTAVVLANSVGGIIRPGAPGRHHGISFGQWEKGNRETMHTLDSAGVRTILFRDSPRPGFDVPVCLSRAAYRNESFEQCAQSRQIAVDRRVFAAEQRAAEGLTNVSLVDFSDLICEPAECPPIRDSLVVYSDDNHLTASYARSLAPEMIARLEPLMGIGKGVSGVP
ncbi:MAG: acyltransferase family protein [Gemmatimonadales bacterium]